MSQQFEQLFQFLKRNHSYNYQIQTSEIRRHLKSSESGGDQVKRLLTEAYMSNTSGAAQHRMKFNKFTDELLKGCGSFGAFCKRLGVTDHSDARLLFNALKDKSNENKTAAFGDKKVSLFVRNLILIKKDTGLSHLFKWGDIDKLNDTVPYIPVDRVITAIFKRLRTHKLITVDLENFKTINNKLLEETGNKKDFMIWDDLWFWGFITQKKNGTSVIHEWNESKYWSIYYSPKDERSILKIKQKSEEFLTLT